MAENSGIEWTHHTFNPWIGCTKVSAACDNCYAERWDQRFTGGDRWGPKAARTRTAKGNWSKPITWNHKASERGVRERVFCASLADVFDNHKSILPEWRDDLWALIRKTPHLDWLLLTKRPQNIKRYLPDDWGHGYKNVWLGTTVENQLEADRRVPALCDVPAAIHFLSCEPLLGPIHLDQMPLPRSWKTCDCEDHAPHLNALAPSVYCGGCCEGPEQIYGGIDWVITGGESGPHHRSAEPDDFRMLRDQCHRHDVPFLFKQWEGRLPKEIKALGRELDGVVHDEYPNAA